MKQNNEINELEPNARQRLLEMATKLFAEKGYAGTSVREIVDRAGVSKPVLYYYFKSKEGLFYALLILRSIWHTGKRSLAIWINYLLQVKFIAHNSIILSLKNEWGGLGFENID